MVPVADRWGYTLGLLAGKALVWSVVGTACAIGVLLCLPLLLVAAVARGLYELGRTLGLWGKEVDGSADGGEPDALTPQLRDVIDGASPALRLLDGRLDADQQLDCGCLRLAWPQAECPKCGYTTCVGHSPKEHYCEPADRAETPPYDWSVDVDWPLANRLKPAHLDDSAAEPNELLTEIYQYLDGAR